MTDLVGFIRSRLDDSPNGPRSSSLARAIEEAIRTGVVGVGEALPAERALCEGAGYFAHHAAPRL